MKTSKTEDILFECMCNIGLKPKRQYLISKHHPDFAFPKEKLVVEVDGPHHRTRTEIERDEKRRDVAENLGWSVKRFTAEEVYENPEKIAWKIKFILDKINEKIIKQENLIPYTNKKEKSMLKIRRDSKKEEERKGKSKKIVIAFCIIFIILSIFLASKYIPQSKPKDIGLNEDAGVKSAVNLTMDNSIIHTAEMDSLCLSVCGSSKIYENNVYPATNIFLCYCGNGYFLFDLRTKAQISKEESIARNEYYSENENFNEEEKINNLKKLCVEGCYPRSYLSIFSSDNDILICSCGFELPDPNLNPQYNLSTGEWIRKNS